MVSASIALLPLYLLGTKISIKSRMKKLKVVEVLQHNDVNMKVISTKRTTVKTALLHLINTPVWLPFLGHELLMSLKTWASLEVPPGKQHLRVTCPIGKVKFKYFLSPDWSINLPCIHSSVFHCFCFVYFKIIQTQNRKPNHIQKTSL